ncbi:MAG: sensor domain-containing diguanylate cyclase [Candidatus Omnitrophota bacterium]|nr:MAG: sensor domain-containing diguanylate cyclase [Candidatus Omnitrophota bacterium]
MPNLILLILAVNAIAALFVSVGIYIAGKAKAQNAIWLVYNILFCIWNFYIYKALGSTGGAVTLYWFRAALVVLIFMAPVFLHFLSIYSDREVFKKEILGKVYTLFFLIFTTFLFMPDAFIRGVTKGIYFKYIIIPGLPFHIFTFIFAGFIVSGFYYLLRSKKTYVNFKRNQRAWLFFGMFFGMLAPLSFFLATYKIAFLPFGLFCVIPYLALVSYTMVKYHVLEVNVVINKMALFSYATLFVIFIHILAMHVLHRIIGIGYFESSIVSGCIILFNLLFAVHYARILKLDKTANHIVYEKRLEYYKFLEEFNSMLVKTKDLGILLRYVVDSLANTVGVECVSLYLFDEKTSSFRLKISSGIDAKKARELGDISAKSPLIDFLKEGNIFVTKESEDFAGDYNLEEIKKAFSRINVKLTIPLYYSMPLYYAGDIVGFLNLSGKKDRTDYTKEDIDILNAIGRQVGICLDTTRLLSMSIEDDLTKLYKHSYFHKRVEEEVNRCRRYNRVFSLLMIDIDNFKEINDVFGHLVGDEVLRRLAGILKVGLRKVDIVARYGGEEFGILLPETTKSNAFIAAERIRARIEEEFTKTDNIKQIIKNKFSDEGNSFKVNVSIGVSSYRPDVERYQLIKEADEALYRAKAAGKNKVC